MHGRTLIALALFLVGGGLTACNDSTKSQLSMLNDENRELRDQLAERDRALDATTSDLREANRLLREQQELAATAFAAPANPFSGIDGVSSVDGNEVTVSMQGDILFIREGPHRRLRRRSPLIRLRMSSTPTTPGR